MSKATQKTITILFLLYLAMVMFTGFSLTGFWTDMLATLLLSVLSILFILRPRENRPSKMVIVVNRLCSAGVIIFLGLNLLNPFAVDQLNLRSFYFQSVDGRLFNAYFKPVGAYSGGYGNFWITETMKYFPVIEREVYYNRTVDYDFNDDNFDRRPTDNYEVVRNYIRQEVTRK